MLKKQKITTNLYQSHIQFQSYLPLQYLYNHSKRCAKYLLQISYKYLTNILQLQKVIKTPSINKKNLKKPQTSNLKPQSTAKQALTPFYSLPPTQTPTNISSLTKKTKKKRGR